MVSIWLRPENNDEEVMVMLRKRGRWKKGFSTRNSEVSLMSVAERLQQTDGCGDVIGGAHNHIKVDDRFSGQPGNCRASDVFDGNRNITHPLLQLLSQLIEQPRPPRVIVDDDDRFIHNQ